MHVINKASLLLKMVIIRVDVTISVEETIINVEHIGLKYILVFHQVLALVGEHVSVLRLEVVGQGNIHLWCIVGVSSISDTHTINGVRHGLFDRHGGCMMLIGEGLNVITVVTQSIVKWGILGEQGIALSVLNGGESALSLSEASSSMATFTVSAWI